MNKAYQRADGTISVDETTNFPVHFAGIRGPGDFDASTIATFGYDSPVSKQALAPRKFVKDPKTKSPPTKKKNPKLEAARKRLEEESERAHDEDENGNLAGFIDDDGYDEDEEVEYEDEEGCNDNNEEEGGCNDNNDEEELQDEEEDIDAPQYSLDKKYKKVHLKKNEGRVETDEEGELYLVIKRYGDKWRFSELYYCGKQIEKVYVIPRNIYYHWVRRPTKACTFSRDASKNGVQKWKPKMKR